jgi:hypothetical protein
MARISDDDRSNQTAMQDLSNSVGQSSEYAYKQGSGLVEEHPASAVATGVILGFGLGVLVSMIYRQPPRNRCSGFTIDILASLPFRPIDHARGALASRRV